MGPFRRNEHRGLEGIDLIKWGGGGRHLHKSVTKTVMFVYCYYARCAKYNTSLKQRSSDCEKPNLLLPGSLGIKRRHRLKIREKRNKIKDED